MYLSDREIRQKMEKAWMRLSSLALPSNSVVVFDIDSTLIDERGARIESVCRFYDNVLESGLIPMIITSRVSRDNVVEETEFQLYINNILDYECIYFRDPKEKDIKSYKVNSRRNIWERGYKVIMSIGDQPWDIGEYGGIGVLLQ